MRIDRLCINGFGKFDKIEFILADGLNLFYGANESGKTTLQDFISSMLYSLDKAKEKRYIPWKKSEFGIANKLLYTLDKGNSYIIEKNFNRNATRVFEAEPYNDVTGSFPVNKKNIMIMEEHTGLNLSAFEATALVRQAGVRFDKKKHTADITERLIRLSRYGDEDIDYKNAISYLDNISSDIGGGGAGKYKKLVKVNQHISDLEREKECAETNIAKVRKLNLKINEIVNSKNHIESEIKELELLNKHKKDKLLTYNIELRERLDKLVNSKSGNLEQLSIYSKVLGLSKYDVKEVDELYTTVKLYKKQLDEMGVRDDEPRDYSNELNQKSKGFIRYLFTGIPLIIAVFALFIREIKPQWYILAGAVLLVFMSMHLFEFYKKKDSIRQNKIIALGDRSKDKHLVEEELNKTINLIKLRLNSAGIEFTENDMVHVAVHEFRQAYDTGIGIKLKLDEIGKEIVLIKANLNATLDSVGEGTDDDPRSIPNSGEITIILNKYKLESNYSTMGIDTLITSRVKDIRGLDLEQSAVAREIEILSDRYRHPGDIEHLLNIALNEKKEYEATKEAAQLAKSFLKLALSEIQQNFIPVLNKHMGEALGTITAERYNKVDTGSSLDIVIKDAENGTIDPMLLSSGTIDQVYFSLRLAMSQMLSIGETLPLIIDEPFAYYDDKRLRNALSFLCDIAKKRQVILFTCQKRELDIIKTIMDEKPGNTGLLRLIDI